MTRFARTHIPADTFDTAVSVPLDTKKERERGFNQSARVARLVARELGIPHMKHAIRRSPSSSPQALLTRSDREKNVSGHFAVCDAKALRGRRILLIDDVLTTGYTASECARVLKEAGAASVVTLVCARGA
jgi:ComF family protein